MRILKRFLQCIFVWGVPRAKGDLRDAQVILTQAMCNLTDGSVSKTNKLMANLIARLYSTDAFLPVFPQGELSRAIREKGVPLFAETELLISNGVLEDGYLGSYEVAFKQKELCDKMGWKKVVLVSFAPHIWRAKWVYEKLGFEVIIPAEMPRMVFEKGLAQTPWRRAITGYSYEFLARVYYLWKGYI